jgi:hypothetical protein
MRNKICLENFPTAQWPHEPYSFAETLGSLVRSVVEACRKVPKGSSVEPLINE